MTTEELLNKLDQAEKMAVANPDDPKYARTRTGIETAVQQAKRDVVDLRTKYAAAILKNGVAIFLNGPKAKAVQFAQLINELGEAVVVDAEELYNRLARPIEALLGPSRNFSSECAAALVSTVGDMARELGTSLNRPLKSDRSEAVPSYGALLEHVRNLIRDDLGDSLAGLYLSKIVGREGLKIRYMGNVSPVIILNAIPGERGGISQAFGKGNATIDLADEDEINKEFIGKAFANVQKRLRKSST